MQKLHSLPMIRYGTRAAVTDTTRAAKVQSARAVIVDAVPGGEGAGRGVVRIFTAVMTIMAAATSSW